MQELLRNFQGWVVGPRAARLGPLRARLRGSAASSSCRRRSSPSARAPSTGSAPASGSSSRARRSARRSRSSSRSRSCRKRIEKMTAGNAKFAALDKAIAKEGAKIVFLVRLSPVFPFTYINYAFGLTGREHAALRPRVLRRDDPGHVRVRVPRGRGADGRVGGRGRDEEGDPDRRAQSRRVLVSIFVARVAAKAIKSAGVDEAKAPPAPGANVSGTYGLLGPGVGVFVGASWIAPTGFTWTPGCAEMSLCAPAIVIGRLGRGVVPGLRRDLVRTPRADP